MATLMASVLLGVLGALPATANFCGSAYAVLVAGARAFPMALVGILGLVALSLSKGNNKMTECSIR